MAARNFVAIVKERQAGQPCFLQFELYEDIGLGDGKQMVSLDVPDGTDIEYAQTVAKMLNDKVARIMLTP